MKRKADAVGKLLRKAAAILQKRGLHKGDYSSHGRVCIFGAINLAAYGQAFPPGKFIRTERAATDRVNKLCGGAAWVWSDRAGITKAMAVAKLREAAKA